MYEFFKAYDPRAAHDSVVQELLVRLITKDPNRPIALLLILRENALVGHILLTIEFELGNVVCYINQVTVDGGHLESEDMISGMEFAEAFAKSHGAERLILITEGRARAYERRYGFKTHRIQMVKDLNAVAVTALSNGQHVED